MIGHPLKVEDIVSELQRGGIRVPEIQRSYVWKRPQIAKLLDSVYRSFPAGSILLWDTTDPGITRPPAMSQGERRPDFVPKIVLDGQQRITSLGRIFDVGTPKEDRVLFNVLTETFEVYSPRNAADPRWIDVTEMFTDSVTELDVLDRLIDAGVLAPDNRQARNEVHGRLKRLTAIRKYQFPVEIVREDDLEVVTEIFIRVNSAGTRLREAELALARMAWKIPGSVVGSLHETEQDCQERGFDLDSRFLMRALISVATHQCRFRDLKAFWARPADELVAAWERTEHGISLTLDFVEGNVGIPGSELLPSSLSLIPLVAVFSAKERLSDAEVRTLRRWFLIANAFSRYVGSPETTLNQDLSALGQPFGKVSALLDQTLKDLRSEPKVTPQDLERASINSPFFPLAYLAAIRRDAADWFRGIKVRRESFTEDQRIEYHHIFPKRLLDDRDVDRFLRDEMANIAFLSQRANRSIRASEPIKYLPPIAESAPERLKAQCVPMDPNLWHLDRFQDFVVTRRQLLADAMNEVLGE